jgi:hypothetical protein
MFICPFQFHFVKENKYKLEKKNQMQDKILQNQERLY